MREPEEIQDEIDAHRQNESRRGEDEPESDRAFVPYECPAPADDPTCPQRLLKRANAMAATAERLQKSAIGR